MLALSPPLFIDALQRHWRHRTSFTLLDLDFNDGRRLLSVAAALFADGAGPRCLHYFALAERWDMRATTAHADASGIDAGVEFGKFVAQLSNAWLPATSGFQRLILAEGRLVLTLVSGMLAADLPQLDLAFDAAYCRYEDMESNAIRWLGRLAGQNALIALGGDAGHARNADRIQSGLAQAGFADVAQSSSVGDAGDRMLRFARRMSSRSAPRQRAFGSPPDSEKQAIVIGAGLAGAAACHRLVARGWRCTVIERHGAPACEASGNAAGIFMPVLSQDDNPLSRLSRAAFLFALHLWDGLGGVGAALQGQRCGVLQLPRSDARPFADMNASPVWPADFARRLCDAQASAALGQRVAGGGWWFEKAGWLRPGAVCEAMLAACGERSGILYGRDAARLHRTDGVWRVLNAAGSVIAQATTLILANGVQAMQFAQMAQLPLQALRGQVTHLPAQAADVPFVVCGDAYLTPAIQGQGFASLGATYDRDSDAALRMESHHQNIQHLQAMLPDWSPQLDMATLDSRVGFRCVTSDRLPLVGALPDLAQTDGNGSKRPERLEDVPRLAGLYGLLGYGSRGLIWAPLAAELLAAQLNGEPSPLPRDLVAMLDPGRFVLRQRRRAIHSGSKIPS